MTLYIYTIVTANGNAPCHADEYCTLGLCKPRIRKSAKIGDWVLGMGSKEKGYNNKVIYLMKVKKKLTFDEYFKDPEFKGRKDNIYFLDSTGKHAQSPNATCHHKKENIETDLEGKNVLIADKENSFYFGKKAIELEKDYEKYIYEDKKLEAAPRGEKVEENEQKIEWIVNFIKNKFTVTGADIDSEEDKSCDLDDSDYVSEEEHKLRIEKLRALGIKL